MTSAVAERVGLVGSLTSPRKLRRSREVAKISEEAPELPSTTRKT
jgi:hypothetical protein